MLGTVWKLFQKTFGFYSCKVWMGAVSRRAPSNAASRGILPISLWNCSLCFLRQKQYTDPWSLHMPAGLPCSKHDFVNARNCEETAGQILYGGIVKDRGCILSALPQDSHNIHSNQVLSMRWRKKWLEKCDLKAGQEFNWTAPGIRLAWILLDLLKCMSRRALTNGLVASIRTAINRIGIGLGLIHVVFWCLFPKLDQTIYASLVCGIWRKLLCWNLWGSSCIAAVLDQIPVQGLPTSWSQGNQQSEILLDVVQEPKPFEPYQTALQTCLDLMISEGSSIKNLALGWPGPLSLCCEEVSSISHDIEMWTTLWHSQKTLFLFLQNPGRAGGDKTKLSNSIFFCLETLG